MADGLSLRGVCAGYRGRAVLEDVTLTAAAGEVCALLGLNGSGKSTLLRAVLGAIPVTRGEIEIGRQNARSLPPKKLARLAAYLPQRSRADDGMTALETVLTGANAETPLLMPYNAAQRERARACLRRMNAGAFESRCMGELSQGQRQSVLLARALMQRPGLLLLDEPDAALDLPARWQVLREVRALAREENCAALCALHDASLALSLCDRVMILKDGRIGAALDMRAADGGEVERAMRGLYGDVTVIRRENSWAVLG